MSTHVYGPRTVKETPASSIVDGAVNVATIGTPVSLGSASIHKVIVQANQTNTGDILVGDNTPALILKAGDQIAFSIDNLSKVFIDATVAGEGVTFVAEV